MKALYLDGRLRPKVLLDGPALRVRVQGRADGCYPLPRIARVVACGAVNWHPYALLACLHFGVAIAQLDSAGRFVRLRFPLPAPEHGLARHLGELLGTPRYRRRYEAWLRVTEQREISALDAQYGVCNRGMTPQRRWQSVIAAQSAGPGRRVGHAYRYLRGLTMAHVATVFSRIGLPADPEAWSVEEYRFLNDIVRLEQWRQPPLVGCLMARGPHGVNRRALTEAFESQAEERERRIAAWRQSLLPAMMGIRIDGEHLSGDMGSAPLGQPVSRVSHELARICEAARERIASNMAYLPRAAKDSLRTSIKILRAWLDYDRRVHEPL